MLLSNYNLIMVSQDQSILETQVIVKRKELNSHYIKGYQVPRIWLAIVLISITTKLRSLARRNKTKNTEEFLN